MNFLFFAQWIILALLLIDFKSYPRHSTFRISTCTSESRDARRFTKYRFFLKDPFKASFQSSLLDHSIFSAKADSKIV